MENNNETPLKKGDGAKVLRTYTSDMADAIRENEASVIKIALAEKAKREQEAIYLKAEGTKTSKILFFIGGIILILGAIALAYFLIEKKKDKETPKPVFGSIESYIAYDDYSYIDVTNFDGAKPLSEIFNSIEQLASEKVRAIFLTKDTEIGVSIVTTKEFFRMLKSEIPDSLLRTLSDKFLIGQYTNQTILTDMNRSSNFLILRTSDYTQAYSSVLEWEESMLLDLYSLFNINVPLKDSGLLEKSWEDILVNNRDVRVIYGENQEGILYYTFINKNSLLITDRIETIKEIANRLIIKNYQ